MNKIKKTFRRFKLSLIFALIVFIILFFTMSLTFFGTHLLRNMGYIRGGDFEHFPLFMFSLASVIIGTALSIIFSKAPLRPLHELMDAVDKIADGDYNVRIDLKRPREFHSLSDKFNHMAEELNSVEMLRSDFVNNFSHEFKTPIVSIRGFAKALKWDDLTDEEREEYLDIIISETERLSALSANVLYLSKIEKQAILTDKKRFNLTEQIRLAIALLDKKATEKHIEILFDNKECYTVGNEEMLKQVWINLIDNAIKFSPERSTIEIRIKETADGCEVKISDQGCGIPPEIKPHIFDKFYQGEASHSTSGNGLGLAVVKKIVDLHGGRISVRSSDKGSTFEINLKNC